MSKPKHLSLAEKLDITAKLPIILLFAAYRSASLYRSSDSTGWPIRRTLAMGLFNTFRDMIAFRTRKKLVPTTGEAVAQFCAANNLPHAATTHKSEGNAPDFALHKVSFKTSHSRPRVYLYFHGGGYVQSVSKPGHLPYLRECAQAAQVEHLYVLEYTLAPELKYPGQLVQAVAAVKHLLQTYEPSQIILGGDSAGGNLVLAVLAHIISPSPYAPALSLSNGSKDQTFAGALLVSPWVHTLYGAPSYAKHGKRDIINADMLQQATDLWQPTKEVYADMLTAPENFWSGLPVRKTLFVVGSLEVFQDDIYKLADRMGAKTLIKVDDNLPDIGLIVGHNEIHVQSAIDGGFGIAWQGSALEVLQWFTKI